jgi:hypothetical protein
MIGSDQTGHDVQPLSQKAAGAAAFIGAPLALLALAGLLRFTQ